MHTIKRPLVTDLHDYTCRMIGRKPEGGVNRTVVSCNCRSYHTEVASFRGEDPNPGHGKRLKFVPAVVALAAAEAKEPGGRARVQHSHEIS